VFGDGVAVYRNARAVPRAFVVSRYRGFADRAAMLDWIRGPLMTPRETILLDQSDVDRLPNSFLSRLIDDDEGIDLKLLAKETAAEKRAATVLDQKQRHEALLLQPAWGWSAGDRVTIAVHPRAPAETVFLVLEYYPGSPQASRLKAELLGPGGGVEVPIELPGLDANDQATGRPRRVAVDLGRLEDLEYKLSLAISEECPAKVDSLRITRSVPPISTEDAGNVSIVSHKPNRILLSADIKRNAFVLLSEVYFPGWEATVDGRPAPVLRADYILRGVPVEPGKHTIELRYRSKIFLAGLAVSACSGLAVLIILAAPWWREGQRNTPQEHGRVKTPLEGD